MRFVCALLLAVVLRAPAWADDTLVARGRMLAIEGDCVACHTAPDGAAFAGGRPVETPFGTLVTPNLTPDRATGIGAWSNEEFVRAMQAGIGRDGEHLYPAFPYPYFTKVSREDLLAIRAYLGTLRPVVNGVDRNRLDFPFNMRMTMLAWNALFFVPGPFRADAAKSAEWNRGAYLVEGLGHCGACHTDKNVLGADRNSRHLQGGAVQDWLAPALTGDLRTGLGAWSVEEVVEYLRTGRNGRDAATGLMAEVVANSTSQMPAAEVRAMAVYLKDLPAPVVAPTPAMAGGGVMQAGAAIYADSCTACHTSGGAGIPRMFPSLKGSAVVQSGDPTTLLHVLLMGARAVATDAAPTGPAMPSFGRKLNDAEMAAVATYIRNSWGNTAAPVAASTVSILRRRLLP